MLKKSHPKKCFMNECFKVYQVVRFYFLYKINVRQVFLLHLSFEKFIAILLIVYICKY